MTRGQKLFRKLSPFMGALFCFFLTFLMLGQQITGWGSDSGNLTGFIAFLPMCFMFMGFTMMAQDDRIQKLELEKAERQAETG